MNFRFFRMLFLLIILNIFLFNIFYANDFKKVDDLYHIGKYQEGIKILEKQGEKIKIKFKKPLFFTRSRRFTSIVRWCKELVDDEGYTYGYGLGVKFS